MIKYTKNMRAVTEMILNKLDPAKFFRVLNNQVL